MRPVWRVSFRGNGGMNRAHYIEKVAWSSGGAILDQLGWYILASGQACQAHHEVKEATKSCQTSEIWMQAKFMRMPSPSSSCERPVHDQHWEELLTQKAAKIELAE